MQTNQTGLRLHHIGHVVREISPAAESYIRRLGYGSATGILHDPTQTAFVQFLCLPGDTVFVELVAPDGPESRLTAAASGKRGALHHLCYTVEQLSRQITRLRDEGMLLIAEPRPAIAFAGRQICWLMGDDGVLIELVEQRHPHDPCKPGL